MVSDLGEVFRLGTAKAQENVDFRRYLSAHHQDDKRFHILAGEVQRHIDCTTCANCCRHSVVSVNHREMEEIAGYLGITPEAAIHLYTEPDPEAPALPILKSSDEGCVFLGGNLCVVYEARPKACREFPCVEGSAHGLGSRPASLARWAALCPIIYNALEEYKHVVGYHGKPAGGADSPAAG